MQNTKSGKSFPKVKASRNPWKGKDFVFPPILLENAEAKLEEHQTKAAEYRKFIHQLEFIQKRASAVTHLLKILPQIEALPPFVLSVRIDVDSVVISDSVEQFWTEEGECLFTRAVISALQLPEGLLDLGKEWFAHDASAAATGVNNFCLVFVRRSAESPLASAVEALESR